jgi:hypothetical protein
MTPLADELKEELVEFVLADEMGPVLVVVGMLEVVTERVVGMVLILEKVNQAKQSMPPPVQRCRRGVGVCSHLSDSFLPVCR